MRTLIAALLCALLVVCGLGDPAQAGRPLRGAGTGGASGSGFNTSTSDASVLFSSTNHTAQHNGAEGSILAIGTQAISGTKYFEFTIDNAPVNNNFGSVLVRVGVAIEGLATTAGLGATCCSAGFRGNGDFIRDFNTIATDSAVTYTTGAHIGVVVNTTSKKAWFTPDGTNWYGDSGLTDDPCAPTGGLDIASTVDNGTVYAAVSLFTAAAGPSADKVTLVTGSGFTFSVPACASALA